MCETKPIRGWEPWDCGLLISDSSDKSDCGLVRQVGLKGRERMNESAKQSQFAAGRLEAVGRRGLHRRLCKTKPIGGREIGTECPRHERLTASLRARAILRNKASLAWFSLGRIVVTRSLIIRIPGVGDARVADVSSARVEGVPPSIRGQDALDTWCPRLNHAPIYMAVLTEVLWRKGVMLDLAMMRNKANSGDGASAPLLMPWACSLLSRGPDLGILKGVDQQGGDHAEKRPGNRTERRHRASDP